METIRRARSIQRGTVESVTRESQSDDAGPAVVDQDPNERIDAQSQCNMQRRQAELDASARTRQEQDDFAVRAPAKLVSRDAAGCWDTVGKRYNCAAGGNFTRSDWKFCTRAGPNIVCATEIGIAPKPIACPATSRPARRRPSPSLVTCPAEDAYERRADSLFRR